MVNNNAPPGGNIFLTTENLAFAMPLLLLCAGYAYFKYIPLEYGIPGVLVVAGVFYTRSRMEARRAEKLQNLDEDMINDIVGEEEEGDDIKGKAAGKKQSKAKAQVERRLAAEKRKAEKAAKSNGSSKKKGGGEEEDDDDDLLTFAKGSREKQKKR